jgi:hypothetical protein
MLVRHSTLNLVGLALGDPTGRNRQHKGRPIGSYAARPRRQPGHAYGSQPAVDLAARSNVADVDHTPIAIHREDDAQAADACASAAATALQRFGVRPVRILGDLVKAPQDPPTYRLWQAIEITLGRASDTDVEAH